MKIDVKSNRTTRNWSRRELAARVAWSLAWPLFRFSPRLLWGWRRALLRLFRANVGREVHIYPGAQITIPWNLTLGDHCAIGDRAILYALGPVAIGARTTVSQGAHICAGSHDWRQPDMPLLKLPISIGTDCWICADAFIGPGLTIGDHSIVAARAVVVKPVPPGTIIGGNPARQIGRSHTGTSDIQEPSKNGSPTP